MKKSTTYKGQAKPFGRGGFFHEPRRHALNRAGIKTGNLVTWKTSTGKTERGLFYGTIPFQEFRKSNLKIIDVEKQKYLIDTDKDGVPDKYDCKPNDPNHQDYPRTFKITDNIEIVAEYKKARDGFNHVATLYVNGVAVDTAKAHYINRTWESYDFQSVMQQLVDKTKELTPKQKELVQEYLKQDHTDWSAFKMTALASQLGDIFGTTKKEKNDWKERMIKAGLGGKGLQMPEDWNSLSEDEKEKRLNKVIEFAKQTGENFNAPPSSIPPSGYEYELEPRYDGKKSFYGKANVRQENGKKVLRSYNTDVAEIEGGKAKVHGTYSPTTLRHIKEFLKQNGFEAETSKQIMKDYGGE